MSTPLGKLTLAELRHLVEVNEVDTVIAAFPDCYGRLVGKRFDANFFVDEVAQHGTHACNYLLTVDMEMEPVAGYAFSNWESGYGDFHLVPDQPTLRKASWLEKSAIILCDLHADDHSRIAPAPRNLLRHQIDRLAELGLAAKAGSEVEYFILNDSYRQAKEKAYHNLPAASQYIEDYHLLQGTREEPLNAAARRHLAQSGIQVECTKGEWGLGQHELNLKYTDVLEMADRQSLYKQCMKELADSLGISVTFMAKYRSDQAGSSCHIHVSLWNQQTNAFVGDQDYAGLACSDLFRWFLGGWMQMVPEVMVFYAPTVNSYKRYQAGSWAPTRLAVAHDNRTAGFRVVGSGNSLRIECRIPGADCNPYLTYAAALASGLYGIENKIEPPEPFVGDAYHAQQVPLVPLSLSDATQRFQNSEFAKQAFGADVHSHYVHFFRTEQAAFEKAVTDWERIRYFERI
ncbi:MAG: glutamine synthetase family protein [Pirellulaceae bacterium]